MRLCGDGLPVLFGVIALVRCDEVAGICTIGCEIVWRRFERCTQLLRAVGAAPRFEIQLREADARVGRGRIELDGVEQRRLRAFGVAAAQPQVGKRFVHARVLWCGCHCCRDPLLGIGEPTHSGQRAREQQLRVETEAIGRQRGPRVRRRIRVIAHGEELGRGLNADLRGFRIEGARTLVGGGGVCRLAERDVRVAELHLRVNRLRIRADGVFELDGRLGVLLCREKTLAAREEALERMTGATGQRGDDQRDRDDAHCVLLREMLREDRKQRADERGDLFRSRVTGLNLRRDSHQRTFTAMKGQRVLNQQKLVAELAGHGASVALIPVVDEVFLTVLAGDVRVDLDFSSRAEWHTQRAARAYAR